jgi:archaellum component FlaC
VLQQYKDELGNTKARLSEMITRCGLLEQQIDQVKEEANHVLRQVEGKEDQLKGQSRQIETLKKQIQSIKETIVTGPSSSKKSGSGLSGSALDTDFLINDLE